jgi:hypothetical protein
VADASYWGNLNTMKTYTKRVLALALFVGGVACLAGLPADANANNGYAWGHYKDGGSYRRDTSRSPYYMQYHWDGKSFDNFEDFVDYLREWIEDQSGNGYRDRNGNVEIDVATNEATDIDDDTATLEGTIDFNDSDTATVWFEYGPDSNLKWRTTKVTVYADSDDEDFGRVLIGLQEDQKYSFRAVGEDEDGDIEYGSIETFTTDRVRRGDGNDAEPTVETLSAQGVDRNEVTIRGSVDMNDFNNGRVFFVYGEDENLVEDVEDDYYTYADIDEEGEDLQKILADSDLDGDSSYHLEITDMDRDTTIYFAIGVEFEDEDGDDVLRVGNVRSVTTDE